MMRRASDSERASRRYARSVTLRTIVPIALLIGCSEPEVVLHDAAQDAEAIDTGADGGFDSGPLDLGVDAGVDTGFEEDATPADAGIPCEDPPTAPIEISESVTFCEGEIPFGVDSTTRAAIRVTASDVVITCLGTRFTGTAGFGTTEEPTAGFLIDQVSRVHVHGCGARGFRYGLIAISAADIVIEEADFSDNF